MDVLTVNGNRDLVRFAENEVEGAREDAYMTLFRQSLTYGK